MIPFDDPLYPSAPGSEVLEAEEFASVEQIASERHPEPGPDAHSDEDAEANAHVVSALKDPANESILDDLAPGKDD